jgi:hypothetical protein
MHSLSRSGERGAVKPTLMAIGILLIYAISNLYLERIVQPRNLLLKTALSLIHFFIWISPLLYFWLKGKVRENVIAPIIVLCLAILFISPLTTIKVPIWYASADIAFHAAKVLNSSNGYLFHDPITSYPSIYPSVYHIILGGVMHLSDLDNGFYLLSRSHMLMFIALFLSVYLFVNHLFNSRIALVSVFFLGAIFDMPSQSSMFYPTPFFMGLTVMVNSLTLVYLAVQGKRWCLFPAGVLTGLAVTIWPAFLPVAAVLALVVFFAPGNKYRRPIDPVKFALPFLGTVAALWMPQYLLLAKHYLLGHHSIARVKGIAHLGWLPDFVSRFILLGGIDPNQLWVTVLSGIGYVILIGTGVLGFRCLRKEKPGKKRFLKMHLLLMLAVLILVDFVLGSAYSRRVQLLFSIPLASLAAYYLIGQLKRKRKILSVIPIAWLIALACGWNLYNLNDSVQKTKQGYEVWEQRATGVLRFIESNTRYGEYIFATPWTYRFVVLGNLIRGNLLAHRDGGTYYSLNPGLSERMLNDYHEILNSYNFSLTKRALSFYNIRYVLMFNGEESIHAGMRVLFENCRQVYRDENFTVLKLPYY